MFFGGSDISHHDIVPVVVKFATKNAPVATRGHQLSEPIGRFTRWSL
jgi:hypothetical protein